MSTGHVCISARELPQNFGRDHFAACGRRARQIEFFLVCRQFAGASGRALSWYG